MVKIASTGLFALVLNWTGATMANMEACPELLDFNAQRLAKSEQVRLCEAYRGRVVLVVNTASECLFTGQYEGLEALYRTYRDRGFVVLGFPSNDFGGQEPGSEAGIAEFCRLNYGVSFPMFNKTRVRNGAADPLFTALATTSGSWPRWNFHKYLIDRSGTQVESFSSFTGPGSGRLKRAIEKLLGQDESPRRGGDGEG